MTKLKSNEDLEIEELERELEQKLIGHYKPIQNNTWKPYKQFISDLKTKAKPTKTQDETIKQLEKDLEIELKKEQKQILKDIKKLSKQLGMTKMYKSIKKANTEIKNTENVQKVIKKQKNVKAFYDRKYSLKMNEKSSYKMKKQLGELFNFEPNVNLNVNMETVNTIADSIYENYLKVQGKFKYAYKQGFYTVVKLTFINGQDEAGNNNRFSTTIRNREITFDSIKKTIVEYVINKFIGGDSEFDALFESATYFIFPLSNKGGCASCVKTVDTIKYKLRTIKLISPKSSNDNCLFMCFAHFLDIKGNTLRFDNIREELKLKAGKIDFKDIPKVAKYFNTGYVLLNQKQEIISQSKLESKPKVHIMLMNDHYYIVDYIDFYKCEQCGKKLLTSNETHQCSNKMTTFWRSRICNKRDFVSLVDCSDKEKISKDSMIFFDLETFQETVSHIPYACGFSYGDHTNVDISYGKNCMDKFLEHISKAENKTICAYNGSGFDFYILLNYLKDKNIPIKNLIMPQGAIISFQFGEEGKENKVFDLYRFTMTSLDKACSAYKIKNHKMKFDVLKIQSWELAEQYKHEVEPYLKYDVLSLSELFFTFNDSIFENDSVNITKYMTLSNMAYSLWQKTLTELNELVEIPDIEKYNFIKRGTYGARCYPSQKEFKSKYYDDVINKKMTYEELIKTLQYIYNADATSLYSASMAGFELLDVKYPTGKSRWSINPKNEFEAGRCGLYEIFFTCPKDIVIPILPRKTVSGGLEWSLLEGSGVYTNVEITNAISAGYKIQFINKCLIWDKTGNLFKSYVDKYYKMKNDADKENNDVKRSIAKLLLNAMYGKTLQRAIYDTTEIISDYNKLLDFFKDYEITDISVLSDNKLVLSGTVIKKEDKITKPCQLGAFVLSYSRQIMMNYMKAIDPTLKTHVFTYTDTDSLHILGEHKDKLMKLGMIKSKEDSSLGYLCSDIKNEGVIISENNLAPKTYFYEYIDNKNELHIRENGTTKGKGIPQKCLDYKMYSKYTESEQKITFSGLRKKNINLTKADIKNGVGLFSIVNNTQTRTFMKSNWKGMDLIDNKFYPKGFQFK
jgi:hypothetical protein